MQTRSTHTCPVLRRLFIATALSIVTTAHAQLVDYILDTGVGSSNIGPSQFDANMTWLNSFDTIEGGELITQVHISFGNISDNSGNLGSDALTIAILNDPNNDHDPADAQLLSITNAQWQDTPFNEFATYTIDPTEVQGVFFVAVVMDVIQGANPAPLDPFSPSAGTQSWLFYNPELNLDDLGSSPFILRMADGPFPGAWMVRATAQPASPCIADFNNDTQLNFFDVSAFLSMLASQDPSADLNNDGSFNFFDISTFLTLFAAGCP